MDSKYNNSRNLCWGYNSNNYKKYNNNYIWKGKGPAAEAVIISIAILLYCNNNNNNNE